MGFFKKMTPVSKVWGYIIKKAANKVIKYFKYSCLNLDNIILLSALEKLD